MTGPNPSSPKDWWSKPSVVLPVIAVAAFIVALLTPQVSSGRTGDARLSSHLSGSLGARVLFETARRFGYRVVRHDSVASPAAADGRTVHAVLAPATPVTREEAHRYLEAVRQGDALLLVLDERSPLSDSLGVVPFARNGILPEQEGGRTLCAEHREFSPPLWTDGRVHLLGVRWLRGRPAQAVAFAPLERDGLGTLHPGDAAAGFPFGRGRIVVVGDPDLLRNDVLRHCVWGADAIAVKMLEWLRAGGPMTRNTIIFDEYHQGFGSHPSTFDVTLTFLTEHPIGRAILVGLVASIVLLLAVAPRAIVPQPLTRIERRDPLEQVDALAHAYEQVHASRTVTARLLRGLRWRVERSGRDSRTRPDDAFLSAAMVRIPALAADVSIVRRALRETIPDRELPALGAALRRIEHSLTTNLA
ncbi:MAG: DUF4350 domain-containing protein [bacterium]